jgi:hypothetical protein
VDLPAFITRDDIMQALGIKSEKTIRKLIAAEKIPAPSDHGGAIQRWPAHVLLDLANGGKVAASLTPSAALVDRLSPRT